MSVTYVDTDLLEQMRDKMGQALSRMEDCAGILCQMHSQMMAEDLGLSFYPQWEQAVERCGNARRKTGLLCETAERFLTVLEDAPERYRELEQRHIRRVEGLHALIPALAAGFGGVMAAEYPVGLTEGGRDSQAVRLEQRMAPDVRAPEEAGLMAVTQVLKEIYACEQVLPMASPSEEDDGEGSLS
ncbi:MAG: hypothetical protein HFI38_04390 [Lachnospiraceae bacterium]|jgi:hypothetical protein|nr:hypothetical protein [Lachnospiraceae bacterium]